MFGKVSPEYIPPNRSTRRPELALMTAGISFLAGGSDVSVRLYRA